MAVKTNLTLAYINQYLKKNNVQLPKDIDLSSIFKECDKYDEDGNEIKNGDGILQVNEVREFLNKVGNFGFKFRSAMFECWQEVIKKQDQEKLEAKQEELKNPPKRTDEDFEDKAFDYIYAKLDSAGIGISKIDLSLLVDIYTETDWDMDDDFDSIISKDEINKFYNSEYANQYMNKDKNGKTTDTHVLDWIVNKYIADTKQENGN